MGSIMDSRCWVCPSCCHQFDWKSKTSNPSDHDEDKCEKSLREFRDTKEELRKLGKKLKKERNETKN